MGLDIVHGDLAFGRYLLYTNVDIYLLLGCSFSSSDEIYYVMSFVELDPSEVKRGIYEAISVSRRKHDKKFRLLVNPSIFIGISKIK
jgi:hypothetical protein